MIVNYLKTAIRIILRNKITTLINVLGLSIAMTATVLIILWVNNELSFDTYNNDSDRIYRVTCVTDNPENKSKQIMEYSPLLLADFARNTIPEIEASARLFTSTWSIPILRLNDELYSEPKYAYIDRGWFELFKYNFLEGGSEAFFRNPFSVILTESKAKAYFGNAYAIGKIIKIDSSIYTVRGVIKDNPNNSSFQFDVYIPLEAYLLNPEQRANEENWSTFNYLTFVKLKQNSNIESVSRKLNSILVSNSKNRNNSASLKQIKDLHFESGLASSVVKHGNKDLIFIFSALAFILLLIACINYNNLTTAEASSRSKEVSVRKIIGAKSSDIFFQFFVQSLVICLISLLLALLLIWLSMPIFNQVSEKQFLYNLFSLEIWKVLGFTTLIAILLSCIYPSILLSSFDPLKVFRGISFLKFKDVQFRKILVVIQFCFSISLLISTLIIYRQLHYIQTNDLNFNKTQIFSVSFPIKFYLTYNDNERRNMIELFKDQLKKESSISEVSNAGHSLINVKSIASENITWDGKDKRYTPVIAQLNVDQDFKNVFDLSLIQGRWFKENNGSDQHNYIFNETAVTEFNLRKPLLEQRIIFQGDTGRLIGIVKDFYFQSLHDRITPLIIYNNPFRRLKTFIKVQPGKSQEAVEKAKLIWKSIVPEYPFEFLFVDSEFEALYKNEINGSTLILLFSIVSICTSLLGLLGLVILVVQEKTKEIGIRKVLGASLLEICSLISKEFLLLVLIAFLIATPVAYLVMNKWIQEFAYHIGNEWILYFIAGATTLFLVLLTVCLIIFSNSRGHLTDKIRYE